MLRCVAASVACLLFSAGASAQLIEPAPSLPLMVGPPPVYHDVVVLKAGQTLAIKTLVPLSSLTSKSGDRFAIQLAAPIVQDDGIYLDAGLMGEGEVVHAAKAGWGGKPGEMIVNARFLDCGSVRVPIGRLKWSSAGADRRSDAMVASMVFSPAMFFISGGNIEIPANTHGQARLAADVTIRRGATPECSVAVPVTTPIVTIKEEKKP